MESGIARRCANSRANAPDSFCWHAPIVGLAARRTSSARERDNRCGDRCAHGFIVPVHYNRLVELLRTVGWLACVVYSTVPLFWLMVHPRAYKWREQRQSPFRVLLPAWLTMWIGVGALTAPWRTIRLYTTPWTWIPAMALFAGGFYLYIRSGAHFSWAQLGGLPEVRADHREDRLIKTGIRARVRHPVYLAHLCEMVAWSLGTGLLVCWLLTAFAIATGAAMIRMEDAELEKRFGEEYRRYQGAVPALIPRL
jgi:protein-S-isoprenylcysteine O-methyltransferase Ste14